MKIKEEKGTKFVGDKTTWFITNDNNWECISMRKILLLINRISLNEKRRYGDLLKKDFWFQEAINEVLECSKEGVDFWEKEGEEKFINICKKWKLPISKIKQTKINDFGGCEE